MLFNEYQAKAWKFNVSGDDSFELMISRLTLGIADEAGEVAGKVKKWLRKDNLTDPDMILADTMDQSALAKELGDVLWYISALAKAFDIELEEIAALNIEKLQDRKDRNVIKGSGDDR